MAAIYIAACNECPFLRRFPDGERGKHEARAAAMNHAAECRHAVAVYTAELVELVTPGDLERPPIWTWRNRAI